MGDQHRKVSKPAIIPAEAATLDQYCHDDPDLASQPVKNLLFNLIEEDGGPLIWPRITESEQKSFDATYRKLYRFLQQGENP